MRIVAGVVPSDPRTAKTGTLTQSTTTREPDSVHHLAPGGGEPETMGGQRTVWSADGCHLPPTISRAQHPPLYLPSLVRQPAELLNEANSTSRRRLRELALGRVGRTRRSGSRNTRRRALRGPDQTPWHRSSRALNVARFPIFTADQTRCRGRGPGRAAVCRADEKQIEYKSRRMRRELATTPAWVLS